MRSALPAYLPQSCLASAWPSIGVSSSQCCVRVYMCVRCHSIYSGRQICRRTSRGQTGGRPIRICPPSFCGACLNFSREKDSAVPFPHRPLSRILWANDFIVFHLLVGSFVCVCVCVCVCIRKNPSSCDDTEIRTHVPTSDGFEVTN